VSFVGGGTSASGVYYAQTMGYQASLPGLTVGALTSVWSVLNAATGNLSGFQQNAHFSSNGGDLISRAIATDRFGNLYIGATRSESSLALSPHDGRIYREALPLTFETAKQDYVGDGDDGVNGIALTTPNNTGNAAIYGGFTNSTLIL